jgi:hypothetical protein
MATIITDSFTGADNAPWDATKWISAENPTSGGGTRILANAGRMTQGTTGGYSGADRISRRWNITDRADVEMTGQITFDTSDGQPAVHLRADTPIENGYVLRFNTATGGSQRILRVVGFAETRLASIPITPAKGSSYRFRFRAVGARVQAKLWAANVAEPGAWDVDVTDASPITAAGRTGIAFNAAGTTTGFVSWDDLAVNDPTTLALSGVAQLSGIAALTVAPRPTLSRTVASTGTGTLAAVGMKGINVTAALSGSGTLGGVRTSLVAMSGTGALTSLGRKAVRPTFWVVRDGVLVPATVRTTEEIGGFPVLVGSSVTALAAFSASGTLTTVSRGTGASVVAGSGSGALSFLTKPALTVNRGLFGNGALTATGRVGVAATAALTGAGALSATGASVQVTGPLAGSGTLTASGVASQPLTSDNFTGTTGAAWSSSIWLAAANPVAGGGATIQSNAGRMTTGSTGGYAGGYRIARRWSITDRADSEFTGQVTLDSSDPRAMVVLRGDATLENGYILNLFVDGGAVLSAGVAFNYTDLGAVEGLTLAQGSTYKFRFRAVGSHLQAKVWLSSASEPSAWDIDVTDTRVTAAGKSGVALHPGNGPSLSVTWDNLVLTNPNSANAITGAAALSGSGTLTATGSASQPAVFTETFTGTTGAAWDTGRWASPQTASGGSTSIQANAGRMLTGVGGYAAADRISRRMVIADRADSEVTGTFLIASGDPRPFVVLRGDADLENGYLFDMWSTPSVRRAVSFSYTTVGNCTGAPDVGAGTTYAFRFQLVGSRVRAKVWVASGSEPASWQLDVTDGSPVSAAGKSGIVSKGGSGAGLTVTWDNITLSDPSAPVAGVGFSGTGTLTATATAMTQARAVALTGSGALAATGGSTAQTGTATLAASGTLTATGVAVHGVKPVGTRTLYENATATTVPVAVPSGVAADEVLVAQIVGQGTSITAPSGWTLIPSTLVSDAAAGYVIGAYSRVATLADAGATPTWTTSVSGKVSGIMQRFQNVDTQNLFEVTATAATTSNRPLDITGFTTTHDGAMLISGCAIDSSSSNSITVPASMTEIAQTTGTGKRSSFAVESLPGHGATGLREWTMSADLRSMIGYMVALRPSGARTSVASFTGAGTLAMNATAMTQTRTADLTGVGTLAAGGSGMTQSGAATTTGSGALAAAIIPKPTGVAVLAGSGALTATGTVPSGITFPGSPTLYENATGTSVPLAVPSGVQNGELLWVHIAVSGVTLTAPSGWTLAPNTDVSANNSDWRSAAYYRVASSDSGVTHTWTGVTSGRVTGIMQRVAGVNTTTPLDVTPPSVVNLASSSGLTTITVGPLTTVTDGAALLSGSVLDSATANSLTPPASMTAISAATGTGRRAYLEREMQATHGSTGTRVWTASNSGFAMAAYLVALRPA